MEFKVEPEIIEPIIKDQVAAAVLAQIGDPSQLVIAAVKQALDVKVNSHGKKPQYRGDEAMSFVEFLAGKTIREAATQAVIDIVAEQKPAIEKAVRDHLSKAPKRTATAIVNAFANNCKNAYKLNVKFDIQAND